MAAPSPEIGALAPQAGGGRAMNLKKSSYSELKVV